MRDVENAEAPGGEAAHQVAQGGHLVFGERGRGLVHHEDADVGGERLRHLDDLLPRDGEFADGRSRADADGAEVVEQPGGPPFHRRPVDEAEALRLPAEEDVLGHGAVRQECQLLVDDADARRLGLRRVAERPGHAVDFDAPAVGSVLAAEQFHESRLAGAVLADDGVDLTGEQIERDVMENSVAEEAL